MFSWIILIILIIFLLVLLTLVRLRIPRNGSLEGIDDPESIQAYDSVSHWTLFSLIRYRVIQQLKRRQPEGTLLDAGCGPGFLDIAIAEEFPQLKILGIDISKEVLELAIRNQSALKLNSRMNYQEANVEQLPFDSSCIDFVISTLSMHHLTNPDEALQEIYRVLKPGGQLLIFDLRRDMPGILLYLIRFGQRFFAPIPIRRVNGGVGSVWSSFTAAEIKMLLYLSPFSTWKIQKGWGWFYVWGKKSDIIQVKL